MRTFRILPLALLLTLAACSSTQRVYDITEVDAPPEYLGDSLVVEAARERVRYIEPEAVTPDVAPDRDYDLLTTSLDLQFDFADEAVMGTARHTLTPLRDGLRAFYFHAEAMDIAAVRQVVDGQGVGVGFGMDSARVTVTPRTPLRLGETYEFVVDYIAHPGRGAGQGSLGDGGKGLYFIDPEGTDPYRPTQIWTQGQAQSNRRWFPTWDYPNDRHEIEIALTVPDSMRTAANGALVEQTDLGDGMRRDRWRMSGDHASYLTAIVAGDFATVRDSVESISGRTIPLEYLVEPAFEDEAQAIFGETPAMISFFETYLGVPYPWDDYKQAAVRDYTAGGMENTTITTLFEHVQTDARARLDYTGRDLISHELAHQWFGDLATTKDWANLALNESFASYLEALYLEDAFGFDEAQAHAINDRLAYFRQAERLRRPIVWYGYDSPNQMFDTHTYQKGAQVLHQLRFELGDADFRRGLHRYLTDHAFGSVELGDLRRAFEGATGRSLRRFFEQWWRQPGHPVLAVEQAYFAGSRLYTVHVVQQQARDAAPTFHFDVNVELNFPTAPRELRRVRIASADTTLRFQVPEKPSFVRFNEGYGAFIEPRITQPLEETLVQAVEDDEMAGRYDAVVTLARNDRNADVRDVLVRVAREDGHELVRARATEALAPYAEIAEVQQALRALAREDAAPSVRRAALGALVPADTSAQARAVVLAALDDASYQTQALAVRLAAEHFRDGAFEAFRPHLGATSWRGVVERALVDVVARYRLGGEEGARFLAERAGVMNQDHVRRAAVEGLVAWARLDEGVRALAVARFRELDGRGTPALRRATAEALRALGEGTTRIGPAD